MAADVIRMHADPLSAVYELADAMEEEDFSQAAQKGRAFAQAMIASAHEGCVALKGVAAYLLSGGDGGALVEGCRAKLDDWECRGYPPLAIVAAGYLRQLDKNPGESELTKLSELVEDATIGSGVAVRQAYESLHLGALAVASLTDHHGVVTDVEMFERVAAASLIANLPSDQRSDMLVAAGYPPASLSMISLLATSASERQKDSLKQALAVGEDDLCHNDLKPLVEACLTNDIAAMIRAGYLDRDLPEVVDCITIGADLLSPEEHRRALAELAEECDPDVLGGAVSLRM